MAWTDGNNNVLYKRIENSAATLQSLREEFARIKAIAAEFGTDITDQTSGDHVKSELVNFRDEVINPFLDFFDNTIVAARNRETDLQEWITEIPA